MLGDIALVAAKDLRIEWRSKLTSTRLMPFAIVVLVLFGLALDANRATLRLSTSGLFWVTALFATVMTVQRSTAIEADDDAGRTLLLAGVDPLAVFVGKALAVAAQLLAVEVVMLLGVGVFYEATVELSLRSILLVVATCLTATVGLAAAGSLLGVMVAGARARETVLPILLWPILVPVLISASRAFDDAFGSAAVNGWPWLGLLVAFAVLNLGLGGLAYGALLEQES